MPISIFPRTGRHPLFVGMRMKWPVIFRIATLMAFMASLSLSVNAQSPIGEWEMRSGKNAEIRTWVEIYEGTGGLAARVTRLDPNASLKYCAACAGAQKNQPLLGMNILWGLQMNGQAWDQGFILDPESGKIYDCKVWLDGPDTLLVRGYIKLPVFGQTQTWTRLK